MSNVIYTPTIRAQMGGKPTIKANISNVTVLDSGVLDYNKLINKPQINNVELIHNKSFEDLGLISLTNSEILQILNRGDIGE